MSEYECRYFWEPEPDKFWEETNEYKVISKRLGIRFVDADGIEKIKELN